MKNILLVVTNVDRYTNSELNTGLWLSELTHIYAALTQENWNITIASPQGGNIPIDPASLTPLVLDKLTKQYYNNSAFRNILTNTKSLQEVITEEFDCVYLAGGHATMYDFPNNTTLQKIIQTHYENNKLITAICHGVSGLINVQLSNGSFLIQGKKLTGFDWFEEKLANRQKLVPFNLESEIKNRGGILQKAFIPMTSNVVIDNNLLTGQNPFSSKEMAKKVVTKLKSI